MALINCMECGTEMSDKAKSCPKCGCPNPYLAESNSIKENKMEKKKESTLGIIGAFLSFIIFSFPLEFLAFILCLFSRNASQINKKLIIFPIKLSVF